MTPYKFRGPTGARQKHEAIKPRRHWRSVEIGPVIPEGHHATIRPGLAPVIWGQHSVHPYLFRQGRWWAINGASRSSQVPEKVSNHVQAPPLLIKSFPSIFKCPLKGVQSSCLQRKTNEGWRPFSRATCGTGIPLFTWDNIAILKSLVYTGFFLVMLHLLCFYRYLTCPLGGVHSRINDAIVPRAKEWGLLRN